MNEDTGSSKLAANWSKAGSALGFEVVAPYSADLGRGLGIDAVALVRSFGAPKGMLVLTRLEPGTDVHDLSAHVVAEGFGYSVMSEPRADEEFVLADYVDVLRDWGWAGNPTDEPKWLST